MPHDEVDEKAAAGTTLAGERTTVCFPRYGSKDVLQCGDEGFRAQTRELYADPESTALEELLALKTRLRETSTEDFFGVAVEGISKLLTADMCFIAKRVLADDQGAAVEMPPIGEPGSCLMAAALHICANDGTGARNTLKETKYAAYDCPCAYMRHDKIFVIPDRLDDFITNNPNQLPYPFESYIAVPLIAEGKCFAHFGVMWSPDTARARKLSWAVIELIMHSLEDMILARLLEGSDFVQPSTAALERPRIIPHEAVTAAQSLRPYAGSLSHELRTPMQGVVGMLDVMYATVQEAAEGQLNPEMRSIFAALKENFEAVQDSSRRAVEAADNVVHAYDMDMSVPDGPIQLLEESSDPLPAGEGEKRPEILVAGSNLPMARPNKRRRDDAFSRSVGEAQPHKMAKVARSASACQCADRKESSAGEDGHAEDLSAPSTPTLPREPRTPNDHEPAPHEHYPAACRMIAPGLRHSNLRELMQHVINEGLTVGGRPDSVMAQETALGETIEIRVRRSDGTVGMKLIEWSVDPNVPDTLFIDEMDLSKLISRVFLNAVKFTDNLTGRVKLQAAMSNRGRYISIKVKDNGPGIPDAFLPRLFKAFSQEDPSLTRSTEGLGLGLMVAKGIARKLGGDLTCSRTQTQGPSHGTEFEIKVPLHAGESVSRPSSPFGSPPPPRKVKPAPTDLPNHYAWSGADVESDAVRAAAPPISAPPTPPSPRSYVEVDAPPLQTCTAAIAAAIAAPPAPAPRVRRPIATPEIDRDLAKKYPLTFLVAEDNKINRKLLVSMLAKFGYQTIYEAHDGAEAVRQMSRSLSERAHIDVILMDLWMPLMDGYEATRRILQMEPASAVPTVLAVTADVTDGALERAASVGMKGFMSKPYKLIDLQRLITEYCISHKRPAAYTGTGAAKSTSELVPATA